jgi:hypothetical protein
MADAIIHIIIQKYKPAKIINTNNIFLAFSFASVKQTSNNNSSFHAIQDSQTQVFISSAKFSEEVEVFSQKRQYGHIKNSAISLIISNATLKACSFHNLCNYFPTLGKLPDLKMQSNAQMNIITLEKRKRH